MCISPWNCISPVELVFLHLKLQLEVVWVKVTRIDTYGAEKNQYSREKSRYMDLQNGHKK